LPAFVVVVVPDHRSLLCSRVSSSSLRSNGLILSMGKGFNRAKNNQAKLAKKVAVIGKQKAENDDVDVDDDDDDKKKKKNDRDLFDRLLKTTKGAIPSEMDIESPFIGPIKVGQGPKQKIKKPKPPKHQLEKPSLTQQQKEEKISQRQFFEALVDVETSKALGAIGAAQLVPWVPPYLTDCLVVLADPRIRSGDLRQTMKYLISNLQDHPDKFSLQQQQVAFVTADSVQEIRS
jgi:hypothetical protein